MLSKEEIISIAKSGEGYNAEFKVRVPNKVKELTEEICAFANAAGGVLLLGIDDNNEIIGVNVDNAKQSAIQNSLNDINPHIPAQIYKVDVDGKDIWVIEVNSGSQKPYVLSGAIYVRQGPNSQKLTRVEQMRDFFQQTERIYFDESPNISFNIEKELDSSFFEEFRHSASISTSISREQIMNNLKLLLPDGRMKNGGVLFFATEPEKYIEKGMIRCIEFEGDTKTNIIDDKAFGGPLLKQYHQSMQWLKKKLNIRYEITDGGPRNEIWEIPEVVFKEAIINALAHRDYYDKGAYTTIEVFSDRVEISNPGGLTSAISPADFGQKSHSRNPLIFGLLVRINMVEQVGSGIGRIKELMKTANLPEPIFKTDGIFSVILKRIKSSGKSSGKNWSEIKKKLLDKSPEKLGLSALKILGMIHHSQETTIPEMAKKLKLTERAIEKNIKKLKDNQLLERKGGERGGYWKLLVE